MTNYDKYYEIIVTGLTKEKIPGILYHKHHILPRSIYPEYIKDKSNIVELTPFDHFRAHYYLAQYYLKEANDMINAGKMINAIKMMAKSILDTALDEKNLDEMAKMYQEIIINNHQLGISEECKQKISKALKGKMVGDKNPMYGKRLKDYMSPVKYEKWKNTRKGEKIYTNGIVEVFVKPGESVPSGFKPGRIQSVCEKISQCTKGRIVSDDTILKIIETKRRNNTLKRTKESVEKQLKTREENGLDFSNSLDFIWVNDGITEKTVLPTAIPEGFIVGRLCGKRIWFTDGKTNLQLNPKKDEIPSGFLPGKCKRSKESYRNIAGKKCINNGKLSKFININDPIPDGWTLGKIKSKLIWITDGEHNVKIDTDKTTIPNGWVCGKSKKDYTMLQLDNELHVMAQFSSANAAERETKICRQSIINAMKSRQLCRGFFWILKKDYDTNVSHLKDFFDFSGNFHSERVSKNRK